MGTYDDSAALEACIEGIYGTMYEEADMLENYHKRHGTESQLILTMASLSSARAVAESIRSNIAGKTVIEVGAGVGLLALAMAGIAERVYAIEVDPGWSWGFIRHIYHRKPKNLTFIFGAAEEMLGILHGDVAVVRTRSGRERMLALASLFAPIVLEPL